MSKYGSGTHQAACVMKKLQTSVIKSRSSVRTYEQALVYAAEYLDSNRLGSLYEITPELAIRYLTNLSKQGKAQSTINIARLALIMMMHHVSNTLNKNEHLEIIKSIKDEKLSGRSYAYEQVLEIAKHQKERNSIPTLLSFYCGLRAHEVFTIAKSDEQKEDDRPKSEHKFSSRCGILYTVVGKGGLIRLILVPNHLAAALEKLRLEVSEKIVDRGIFYSKRYNINGGQNFSNSFSQTSKRVLGWSRGAHGLRHTYAQNRMRELQCISFLSYSLALEVVSQEMGHFDPQKTKVYLR